MAQIWLLRCQKNTCTTKSGGDTGATGRTTATTGATSGRTSSVGKNGSTPSCCCAVIAKILRKVKKQSKEMVRGAGASRQSSFQCRYDPLSYSLNFDRSGCGSAVDDDDYYKFYAFSSRFVANRRRPSSTHRLPAAASHSHSTFASS